MEEKVSKRDMLLEAGLAIFYEKGFEKATIDEIVLRAECGKGTFYKYFTSKDDLVDALDDKFKAKMKDKLKKNCPYKLSPEVFFTKLIKTLRKIFKENHKIGIIKFSRAHQANKLLEQSDQNWGPIPEIEYITNYVIEKINSGEISKVEPRSLVACLMGSVHHMLFSDFKEKKPFTDKEIKDVVKVILSGVKPIC
ncbi:MAG: TetR/AcrR family transcriptional regulator [Candidatus Riflebacteria bacterium]|nr:TetR/AcrR family transcriptional regulator [Candidatus Riflebacteria bacterium]